MADATFIDLVGKEAIKDIETLKKQISLTVVEMKELVALSKKIKLPSELNNISGNAAKQIDNLNKQISICSVCHCFSNKGEQSINENNCIICLNNHTTNPTLGFY